jgi:hypothetical protein
LHDRGIEVQRRLIAIVGATAQLKIRYGHLASGGEGLDVMELQEATFGAPAVRAHKGAASLVARPHDPSYRRRHMTGSRSTGDRVARLGRGGKLLLFEMLQQQRQSTVEDDRGIAVGNSVT